VGFLEGISAETRSWDLGNPPINPLIWGIKWWKDAHARGLISKQEIEEKQGFSLSLANSVGVVVGLGSAILSQGRPL